MKVKNRSTGTVIYRVPDFNVRREFAPGEIKEIPQKELEALVQKPGGRSILIKYLQVSKDDIKALDVIQPEQEYFYTEEDVKRIMKFGTQDEFLDMLDFAPAGVMDMIKDYAVTLPLTDLYKVEALKKKTGFDSAKALENLANENGEIEVAATPKRRVVSEEAPQQPARRVPTEYKVISDN
jgi:hypothetical protein